MQTEHLEEIGARLCLLTHAAWEEGLPRVLTREQVRLLMSRGSLCSLVLRDMPGADAALVERARALLGRVKAVCELARAYVGEGDRILLPGDSHWPRSLGALGRQEPLFLFAKGDLSLLNQRRIAVAGSRDIELGTMLDAQNFGAKLADEGYVMVSGGARGVDIAAQKGVLQSGGGAIVVPAVPAGQLLRGQREQRAMNDGQLLILCDTLPDEPFSAQKALVRNHTIFALVDAAVVVASRCGKGGSWQGAAACLRGGWSPVYVLGDCGPDKLDNRELMRQGAKLLTLEKPLGEQLSVPKQLALL